MENLDNIMCYVCDRSVKHYGFLKVQEYSDKKVDNDYNSYCVMEYNV